MNKKITVILLLLVALAVLAGVKIRTQTSYASVSFNAPTVTEHTYQTFTFFNATTTNATSTNTSDGGGYLGIAGAKKVNMYFSRGGATGPNTGLTRFNVQVSPNAVEWYDFNQMFASDVAHTATSTITVNTGTSTVVTSLLLEDKAFYALRCIAVETTDGEHTCKASVEY